MYHLHQNFVHGMTAKLSCHVQNYGSNGALLTKLQWNTIQQILLMSLLNFSDHNPVTMTLIKPYPCQQTSVRSHIGSGIFRDHPLSLITFWVHLPQYQQPQLLFCRSWPCPWPIISHCSGWWASYSSTGPLAKHLSLSMGQGSLWNRSTPRIVLLMIETKPEISLFPWGWISLISTAHHPLSGSTPPDQQIFSGQSILVCLKTSGRICMCHMNHPHWFICFKNIL